MRSLSWPWCDPKPAAVWAAGESKKKESPERFLRSSFVEDPL
jgi:hypothetical protein